MQEIPHSRTNLCRVCFQREVAGVEETHVATRNVALVRLGSLRQEERVILAPYRQEGWLVRAEVLLEGRVERDVALVVSEQVELQLGSAGPAQIKVVE